MNFFRKSKKISLSLIFVLFLLAIFPFFRVNADPRIIINAPGTDRAIDSNTSGDKAEWSWQEAWEDFKLALQKSGSKALSSALRNSLNKIAYDTATYIGSGGRGQNPLFITEGWGTYLGNIGDEAAGEFIEKLGRDPGFYGTFNLCQPNLDVQIKIGMGLKEQYRPSKPVCTFTEMKGNWENELTRQDFLYRFKSMFDPGGNDLLQAFTMHANIIGTVDKTEKLGELSRTESEGWIDVTNLAGDREGAPGSAKRELQAAQDLYTGNFGDFTGDALVDASNVFLNQLAITAFQTAMRKLGEGAGNSTSPYDWSSLTAFEAGPNNAGISGVEGQLTQVMNSNFSIRGDYNILAELTMCPNPNKAGPTNCVITDKFRNAVEEKLTVGEALKGGYLFADGVFGFKADGLEPAYIEGYPYRSMLILRKFRIIPVGWELAAEYIKENASQTYSIEDAINCYSSNDDYGPYSPTSPASCLGLEGLVDPDWVLKAPLNYCKKEGSGPEILHQSVSGEKEKSELSISRNDTYCADEQTCIDEEDDGSCNIYGYCTEEKRRWNFGTDSCEPKYNTCQTFMASDGSKVSYLENTLDLADCSVDNAGCAEYFTSASAYDSTTNNVTWSTNPATDPVLYFDNDVSECSDGDEGCTQLIRTKEGMGANLLPNSSFEDTVALNDFEYWGTLGLESVDSLDGYMSLQLNTISRQVEVGPAGYFAAGDTYVLSVYAKDCGTDTIMTFGGEGIIAGSGFATTSIGSTNEWSVSRVSYSFPTGPPIAYNSNLVEITFNVPSAGACLIDSIKLEKGSSATRYSSYMDTGVVYEKLIPEYLYTDCYENPFAPTPDYRLLDARPLECDNFSRMCNVEEVGCNLYTSIKDNISVPAKVTAQDYCPDVCVGYDAFIQSESSFDSLQDQFFIPNTAESCSAQYAGCDEFTNLDKIEEEGEELEYYTELKQCIKPSDPLADCGEYYTWEGSKETGYQLKVFSLQNDPTGTEPDVTTNDAAECYEAIYYASSTSPLYNPDCREYYATTGQVYYHLYSRTVTCSDNCHPYRRTEDNVVKDPTGLDYTQPACLGLGYDFDTDQNYCVNCINGGVWNTQHNACIYMAVPDEGETCSAPQAGCREYGGNSGSNVRTILNADFEGAVQGWVGAGIGVTNESLMVGGNSLFVPGTTDVSYELGHNLKEGDAYVLSFLAKGDGAALTLDFSFENTSPTSTPFSQPVNLEADEWGIYEINLLTLNHEIESGERLVITATGDYYIDDIRLTNIRDRYYLIKNSWVMPEVNGRDICNWDILADVDTPLYSLFCDQYTDKDNKAYSLRKFTNLCQESAVGCEVMIDTQNSDNFDAEILPGGATVPQVNVPADEYIYAVYDEEKLCDSVNEGCQRMGKATTYENQKLTQDFYIKNNPDEYETTICSATDTECKEWSTNEGLTYFKDPGNQICEWRQIPDIADSQWMWYKAPVNRCDDNDDGIINTNAPNTACLSPLCVILENDLCFDDSDCTGTGGCIIDSNSYDCPTDQLKTMGKGGLVNGVQQPTDNIDGFWAGLCPAGESGCTEYIDPMSKFSPEHLFNSDFSRNYDANAVADGWELGMQSTFLKPFTLYVLSVSEANNAHLSSPDTIYELDDSNNLLGTNDIYVDSLAGERHSRLFYTITTANFSVDINVSDNTPANPSTVSLREAVVDYKIDNFSTENKCNGLINFEEGCVLFNEREVVSGGLKSLNWDADETFEDGNGIVPVSGALGENDANRILEVEPDRECGEWLACKSYVKNNEGNNVCYDVSHCNDLDENGNCSSFVIKDMVDQTLNVSVNVGDIANASGYSKIGHQFSSFDQDYYPVGTMLQVGQVANFGNGGFEIYDENFQPSGWITADGDWNRNYFAVINNPYEAQIENINYPAEGRSFLKYMGDLVGRAPLSEFIEVNPNIDYVVSAMVNTKNMNNNNNTIGQMTLRIIYFDINENELAHSDLISVTQGADWETYEADFTTGANTYRIKIQLLGSNNDGGNVYVDAIKIRPSLAIKSNDKVEQTCRLYPEDDSLTCEYFDDSGINKKGWLGYCLEYDRYPGSENACLLWFPVDKVDGDGDDEGRGYLGKVPVYYSTEGVAERTYEYRHAVYMGMFCGGDPACPPGYNGRYTTDHGCCGTLCSHTDTRVWCFPGSAPDRINTDGSPDSLTSDSNATHSSDGWYEYNGSLWNYYGRNINIQASNPYATYLCDGATSCIINEELFRSTIYTTKIAKTVTEVGVNKFWSGRVFEGSEYTVPIVNYVYQYDDTPFGSINPPLPVNSPESWDGDPNEPLIQRLEFTDTGSAPNAGQIYDCTNPGGEPTNCDYVLDDGGIIPYSYNDHLTLGDYGLDYTTLVKRIFAESYGTWEWNGTNYEKTTLGWEPPTQICQGNDYREDCTDFGCICPANDTGVPVDPCDWCAIVPEVSNIMVNGIATPLTIQGDSFINLTFNTNVDSQQLPLVAYHIDWGDGDITSVTSVKMRDRPSPENPHSLYHLYSYWNLVFMYNSGVGNVDCSVSGICTVRPRVRIKDNWDWCNDGLAPNDCTIWEVLANPITVNQN